MPYIMRHGESLANVGNFIGTDLGLSALGREQAEHAEVPDGVRTVVPSSLARSCETASILAEMHDLEIAEPNPAFDEIRFGDLDGTEIDDRFDELYGTDIDRLCRSCDGDDPLLRAIDALDVLASLPADVLVVSSDTLIRCMQGFLETGGLLPLSSLPQIGNCEVLKYDGKSISPIV
jgi:broad specificity phosphatase PhoE